MSKNLGEFWENWKKENEELEKKNREYKERRIREAKGGVDDENSIQSRDVQKDI